MTPQQPTRLVIVRHTETAVRFAGRCYGSLDVPLSREGRRHARRLAQTLASYRATALYTSPSRRARDTAAPIATSLRLEPIPLADLRELDFGELEGRTYRQIERRWPGVFASWMAAPTAVRFPGGESWTAVRRRARRAVRMLREVHDGETIIAVTHGGVARAVLTDALGLQPAAAFLIQQRYGAINVVEWHGGTASAPLIDMCANDG